MADNIVFDLGAVLFRWEPLRLLAEVFAVSSPDAAQVQQLMSEIFCGFTPEAEWSQFDRGMLDAPQVVQRIGVRTGIPKADLERLVAAIPDHLQPMLETVNLIDALKRNGHSLYYLSNMPKPFAAHLVKANNFDNWFRDGIFSADVRMVKPEADIFQLCEQRWGFRKPVFIDDSSKNIDAASAMGWRAIQFESAAQVNQELSRMQLLD